MSQKIIHWRIAKTAKALAAAAYEELAKDNDFYKVNRSMRRYVERAWQDYIPFARSALVDILGKDYAYEIALGVYTRDGVEKMKAEVHETLVLDGGLKAAPFVQSEALH